jgi:ribosome-binding factor A
VSPKEYNRTDRIADVMQKDLAQLIHKELRDERIGMVTISDVEVTKDLSYANVYVTIYPIEQKDESLKTLNRAAGFLRSLLAKRLMLRTVPKLAFHYDDTLDKSDRINALLNKVLKKDES